MKDKLTMLMILDGFGNNPNKDGNAIKLAKTPNIDKLMKKYSNTEIYTSGLHVGLPEGQMGNSEVGHTNIGAGRIVYQELTRITKSIEEGDFFTNPEFISAIENCKKYNSKLHILGLLSDGGVSRADGTKVAGQEVAGGEYGGDAGEFGDSVSEA